MPQYSSFSEATFPLFLVQVLFEWLVSMNGGKELVFPLLPPRVQRQVQGVMGVMKDNISKVLERGEKLTDLQDKSGETKARDPLLFSFICTVLQSVH